MKTTGKKILLLLFAGVTLGFTYSPSHQRKILKALHRAWKQIDEEKLKRDIRDLYRSKLIATKQNDDGSYTYVLSEKGKQKVLTYQVETMMIPKQKWDGKWRIVIFDIPEKLRSARDAFRERLLKIGFHEIQKSVLVCPYECKKEIDFLVEFWEIRRYVRYGVLESIDNELHLKKMFSL